MSSNYFFEKWKSVVRKLECLLKVDLSYQDTKAHDSTICEASERLTSVLVEYIVLYNEAFDCLQNNTQVQKTKYITDVVQAIAARILELKHELRKLDGTYYQFLANGAASNKLTTYDAEFQNVLKAKERPEHVQAQIDEILQQVKEEKELLKLQQAEPHLPPQIVNWWEIDEEQESDNMTSEDEEEITEEMLTTRKMINMIKSHEKCRQVTAYQKHIKLKREMWIKELNGTLQPPAPVALRERAANFIQKACRAYFDLKRKKMQLCKRDQLLDIIICDPRKDVTNHKADKVTQVKTSRLLYKKYNEEWITLCENLKQDYVKRKGDDVKENYRDLIRDWFEKWFKEIQYFHGIPNDNKGGPLLIIKEEMPLPTEWLEEYKKCLEEKKANKGKSALQLKWEKNEVKKISMIIKRREMLKKKHEARMQKNLKKNPTKHPGYHYMKSKTTHHILKVLENYHKYWDEFDSSECLNVKEKFVPDINFEDAYMKAKIELALSVGEDMREELTILRRALKTDYANNGEKMPEPMKRPKRKGKKRKKLKLTSSDNFADKIHALAMKDILKEYPKTKIEDFLGDHNFAGADLRCNYVQFLPFAGETRNVWWERCCDMAHGANRILIVGPRSSGKTSLVHIYSTTNDAVLFELDTFNILNELISASYLEQLVTTVVAAAKAVQPSVIYIRHVQRLFYKKVPKEEDNLNLNMMKNYLVKKLWKKINKTDMITVIGTCIDPWLTKAKPLLRQFPAVVLVPNTSYSAVVRILIEWIAKNHTLPRDLDVQSLAFVLRGYSYGYLKKCLHDFLSPVRIVKIALNGLNPQDIYDYILDEGKETKVEYEKYLKWYFENTHFGRKEKKHVEEQREFKMMLDVYLEKMKKKSQKKNRPS